MTSNAEAEARQIANQFPTPNVRKAIELAEAGRLTWTQIRDLLVRSVAKALD